MQRLSRYASMVWAALVLVLAFSPVMAADRSTTLLPGTDLPGFDYSVLKQVTRNVCQSTCEADRVCRAFTYNERANWCFLKADVGTATPFGGALSGRIDMAPTPAEVAAAREAELPFPAFGLLNSAREFAANLATTDTPPPGLTYADLVAAGDEARLQSNPSAAALSYRQALAITGNDPTLWLKLADVMLARAEAELAQRNRGAYDLGVVAGYAALNAFLRTETPPERAQTLAAFAHALEFREMWRESIASYRTSLALIDAEAVQRRLDTVVAQHGFRITSHEVDAEAASPRICAVFSQPLPGSEVDLSAYVTVAGASRLAVETEQNQVCVEGVDHGRRYAIRFRSGLPSADGEVLRADVELDVYVPDRQPFVGFANNAYVMPAGLGGGLPINSVNTETADITIYRIGDRSIAAAVRNGIFRRTLDGYSAEDIADRYGEKTWEGQLDLAQGARNAMNVTAVPVADVLQDAKPGAYVITAKARGTEQEYWRDLATQWFIITDLGVTTISGTDGVHAFVRSLTTAQPVANAAVRLVAVNNEILGEGTTDADGRAIFAPGLVRGEAGRAPQLLVAETGGGDYAFLDISGAGFDLTDRGVDGRPSPGALDLFATTERGVYRPGETVFLTALLRDSHAEAVANLPLTMEVERPDGVVASRELLADGGAGGYFAAVPLISGAMRGSWTLRLHADPNSAALATVNFLVEDFEPERLAFEVSAPQGALRTDEPVPVTVAAKYLYGATAPGLNIEADAIIRPRTTLPDFPGYTFGRADDTAETDLQPLGVIATTDPSGNAVAEVTLNEPLPTTRPLEARLILRLVDTNGRAVERTLTRPVRAAIDLIGIRPRFDADAGLAEGSEAAFDVIVVDPDGRAIAGENLEWTLSKVETRYQWYRESGSWKWEAVTTTRRVASGTAGSAPGEPALVSAGVDWGRYQLEIERTGADPASSSYQFYAGYYYPEAGSDTPDTLQVALDQTAYRAGDTATLRLDPQFAGTALIMVMDDRVIDMRAVEVPAEGTSVELPVTEDWGAGAYVTAMLYRPASAAERRMPARALGVAFADVEPGDRLLGVDFEVPQEARPRQPLTVTLNLPAAAGQEAFVAVAAVDLGILNLTGFRVPDPDGWFFGQRQLGMEIRDLYGNLIDPTQGSPGALRSGGDGAAGRLGTPPPTTVLVAQHSGIVRVGENGVAEVTFDMPDFNGTVRLMAVAWTPESVGHASADVVVRDPVVVNLSPPRFLRLDDRSRLLVEVNNLSGPAGLYRVQLTTGEGLVSEAGDMEMTLAVGDRVSLNLDLTATALGDHDLQVLLTAPNGDAQVKRLTLGVRAPSAPRTRSTRLTIEPGATVALDAAYFEGLLPNSGSLTLAVGPVARLDVPGVLLRLDRYPYGCSEQISSRAIPLLYLNEVAEMIGLGSDEALQQRVGDAITKLLANQTSTGSFGLWGPYSYGDLWLDSYVTEFLLRARDEGHTVPAEALARALDNLDNQLSYASDFNDGGEEIAYALYDLARAGRAAIGDLRYYHEAKLDAFGSPLAKAQLGAALALYGDRTRASAAFTAAIADLDTPEPRNVYRADYGSKLRDAAGILALAAEFTPAGVDIAALGARVAEMRDASRYTSTQEDAWTLIAAASLARNAASGRITLDAEPLTGSVYRRYFQEHFEGASVSISNNGNTPTEATVTVTGLPAEPPPAESEGFAITREYFLPDGTSLGSDLGLVDQNQRLIVLLQVTPESLGSGQFVLADPLPAGFEIENSNLSAGSGVADLSWLSVDTPVHVEARTDQYVAAFRFYSRPTGFSTGYMVRAVSPGTFVVPGANVEDMYRPELRGNSASGTVEVITAGP